jgi:diguanylate cyclase (GGDEF)-like protein/PAS domain S-box-containing protein
MKSAPKPVTEAMRLAALRRYFLLDTPAEPEFDRITRLTARTLRVPIALVSFVDADRQWFKSCVGLDLGETSRDVAFSAHAILAAEPFIVEDAWLDPAFADNPLVAGAPFIRFYAGMPLRTPDGHNLGTLCAIDTEARRLGRHEIETLRDLAAVVVDLVEARMGAHARRMFAKVAETSPDAIYVFDLEAQAAIYANRRIENAIGQDATGLRQDRLIELVHPADRARILDHFSAFETLEDGHAIELSYRARDASGVYRNYRSRETIFTRAPDGRPTQILGVSTDVTALIEAEGLASGKARLLEAVLESAGEGIIVGDASGRITLHNSAAASIAGALECIDGHTNEGLFFVDGRRVPPDELPMARALAGVETNQLELCVRDSRFPTGMYVLVNGRPIEDPDNGTNGGVVTFADITELKRAQHRLANLALTDDLTSLANARALRERLTVLAREGSRGRKFAAVVVDVDHFKNVNDTHGHRTGDAALVAVADTLRQHVRVTDFVARYGGEEFVVLFTDVDSAIATALAEKLRAKIAEIVEPVQVTASLGVAANEGAFSSDADALIRAADDALYAAKRAGRNRVVTYRSDVVPRSA